VRQWFESPYRPGEKLTVDEYYQYIFENSVPGLPEAAAKEDLTPLAYMRKYGAFEVAHDVYKLNEAPLSAGESKGATLQPDGTLKKDEKTIGVEVGKQALTGHATPSKKLELYSQTMADWKWPEFALPSYIRSHVHPDVLRLNKGESLPGFDDEAIPTVEWPEHARGPVYMLLPTFRLPTLIHTRSGNAKWLYEISHRNPLWISPEDAGKLGGIDTDDLVKVHTEIGYFVIRAWVTEGIKPGVLACSHHLGRWRVNEESGVDRWSSALVDLQEIGPGQWKMRQKHGIRPWKSDDPDTERVWWEDAGVHQNLTFPVHPDPVSGMHCWHQAVRAEKAGPADQYGDIFVDTNRAHAVYLKWKELARPAPGPGGLRRPLWFARAVRPAPETFYIKE
jgi:anaerobic selenocysteine-containing dehydrogenase